MLVRIEFAVSAIEEAQEEEREHLCPTDPRADDHPRMMMGGRDKQVRECHSFEVAVDTEAGLLVVGQSTQASHDNGRLPDIITAAEAHEPEGETFELTLRGRPQQIGCTPRRTGGCTLPLTCASRQLRTFVRRTYQPDVVPRTEVRDWPQA